MRREGGRKGVVMRRGGGGRVLWWGEFRECSLSCWLLDYDRDEGCPGAVIIHAIHLFSAGGGGFCCSSVVHSYPTNTVTHKNRADKRCRSRSVQLPMLAGWRYGIFLFRYGSSPCLFKRRILFYIYHFHPHFLHNLTKYWKMCSYCFTSFWFVFVQTVPKKFLKWP